MWNLTTTMVRENTQIPLPIVVVPLLVEIVPMQGRTLVIEHHSTRPTWTSGAPSCRRIWNFTTTVVRNSILITEIVFDTRWWSTSPLRWTVSRTQVAVPHAGSHTPTLLDRGGCWQGGGIFFEILSTIGSRIAIADLGEVHQLLLVGLALGRPWGALQLGSSLHLLLFLLNLVSWNGEFLTFNGSLINQLLISVTRSEVRSRGLLLHLLHQRRLVVNGDRISIKRTSIGQKRKRLRLT